MNQKQIIKNLIKFKLNCLEAKDVKAITIGEVMELHTLLSSNTYKDEIALKLLKDIGDRLYKYWLPFKEKNSHARYVIYSLQKMNIYNPLNVNEKFISR